MHVLRHHVCLHIPFCWYERGLTLAFSFGRLTTVDRDITARCLVIMNRADPALLDYMRYHLDKISPEQGETYRLAKEFGNQLLQNCEEALGTNPLYKDGELL